MFNCYYNVIMIIDLIAIGNSQGVRIPKAILRQYGLRGQVELSLQSAGLLISPAKRPRAGWEGRFDRSAEALLPDNMTSAWDDEWVW